VETPPFTGFSYRFLCSFQEQKQIFHLLTACLDSAFLNQRAEMSASVCVQGNSIHFRDFRPHEE